METNAGLAIGTKLIVGVLPVIVVGLFMYSYLKNKTVTNSNNKPISTTYKKYELLLIIDAKRLDKNLKKGSLSKAEAEGIIANANSAYCFEENDTEGVSVLNGVDCSDEAINYDSANEVFLHFSISAKPEIVAGKYDRLGIREAMNPNEQVEVKRVKKLGTARSITAFYSI